MTSSDSHIEDYSLWCFIYINNNAEVAGLVKSAEEYKFSSCQEFLGKSSFSICNVEMAKELLSLDLNEVFVKRTCEIPSEVIKRIF